MKPQPRRPALLLLPSILYLPILHLHRLSPESWTETVAASPTPGLRQPSVSLSRLASCGQIPQFCRDKVGITNQMQAHRNEGVDSIGLFKQSYKNLFKANRPPGPISFSLKHYFAQRVNARPRHSDFQPKQFLSWCSSHHMGKRGPQGKEVRTHIYDP